MRVVIDTNVLLVSISNKSNFHWLYEKLINQEYEVCITNEILTEYEEVISSHWHPKVAKSVLELPNVHQTTIYFNLNLIKEDEDDDKFADCAFAGNCDILSHTISILMY